jgi:hypothetical protein
MTADQLRAAQRKLGCKPSDMMQVLKTPRRTYQDWLSGRRPIPGIAEVAVTLLLEKDTRFMERLKPRQQTTPQPYPTQEGTTT